MRNSLQRTAGKPRKIVTPFGELAEQGSGIGNECLARADRQAKARVVGDRFHRARRN